MGGILWDSIRAMTSPNDLHAPKVLFALSRCRHNGMHGHDIGQLFWPLGTHIMLE